LHFHKKILLFLFSFIKVIMRVSSLGYIHRKESGIISDKVFVNNGTVALPSIAFEGDRDNGIYRTSDGDVGITRNGTQRLRATTSGVVITGTLSGTGISTGSVASPTYTFSVGAVLNTPEAVRWQIVNKVLTASGNFQWTEPGSGTSVTVTMTNPPSDWTNFVTVSIVGGGQKVSASNVPAYIIVSSGLDTNKPSFNIQKSDGSAFSSQATAISWVASATLT
jgi:hypothetical protein